MPDFLGCDGKFSHAVLSDGGYLLSGADQLLHRTAASARLPPCADGLLKSISIKRLFFSGLLAAGAEVGPFPVCIGQAIREEHNAEGAGAVAKAIGMAKFVDCLF